MKRYSKRSYKSSTRYSKRRRRVTGHAASLRGRGQRLGSRPIVPMSNTPAAERFKRPDRTKQYFEQMGGGGYVPALSAAKARQGRFKKLNLRRGIHEGSSDLLKGFTGRGGSTMNVLPYKQLVDALFPIVRERKEAYGFTSGEITSLIGQQAVDMQGFFSQGEIQIMNNKAFDAQNMSHITSDYLGSASQVDWSFMYLGGSITYTITNHSSHTTQVDLLQVKSKRYQNLNPIDRWDMDLSQDNMIRSAHTIIGTVEETKYAIGTRPGTGGRKDNAFRTYYQKLSTKKYILEPGQTVNHTVYFPAFNITGKQLNTEISSGVYATQNPKTQYTMIFTKGVGLISDILDDDVNIGSSKCIITGIVRHNYRASFRTKPYQTFNVNLLPQHASFAAEEEINRESEHLESKEEG